MRGGMKTYRGSADAARNYVEAGRCRADDYYLAEGTGIAQRYVASPDGGVRRLAPLTGDGYEAWVAGLDPTTGAPKGRLRHDDNAVRFVEVVINGPKSWSLAGELHPEIGAAYDAAQDHAATQIIAWLAQHTTTRVGPRGAQVQVPVEEIEAVTVRHRTSRAGDPHRHVHLQINGRVFAEGRWRGLHTVGVRDSLEAINGIGQAAVITHPGFRQALAAHGFILDWESGEVVQLAQFVGPFSARAAQIARNIDRYEAEWRPANPGREPGPALWRAWDARAWADARPDKIVPRDGAKLTRRWVDELHALGYRDIQEPARIDALPVGELNREQAVHQVLSRLAARRSAWNGADIRGEVERLIARRNIVTDAAVRGELAEDLTVRSLVRCVPLLDRPGVAEHIRALTSRHVLDVEADLAARLAARAVTGARLAAPLAVDGFPGLDQAQREVVAALSNDHRLVVVEGAAGAGKTTTLAAARSVIERRGGRLLVVTPTLKAAKVAAHELASRAFSAAWLAYHHGYRWQDDGAWMRLAPDQLDPHTGVLFYGPSEQATLRQGDVLLVDEAGMLDQDTARALLTIADEHHTRLALLGDRHQLPAVGRGGVLDLAARWAAPDASVTLDTVHRFTRTTRNGDGADTRVADEEYARLSLAMRSGAQPQDVFDTLVARGQIQTHATERERQQALAEAAVESIAAGAHAAIVADTRDQVAALNDAIRECLVTAGRVNDDQALTTASGQRIGVGDLVATRRNDRDLQVVNRDTWTVTHVTTDGQASVTREHGQRMLPANYVRDHLELAYASTVHGVQGETATSAHLVVGEHTTAAAAYVGMTRGREVNVAHLVAADIDDARQQWCAVFARDRADLGPGHAADLAQREAARYAQLRPLDTVLADLREAWTIEQDCLDQLARTQFRRDILSKIVAITRERDATLPALKADYEEARATAARAATRADQLETLVAAHAATITATLHREWDQQRNAATCAAQIVRDGSGRLRLRRRAINDATEDLARWATAWQPYVPAMPTRTEEIAAFAAWFDDIPRIHAAFDQHARTVAEHAHPEYRAARAAAERAIQNRDNAWRTYRDAEQASQPALGAYGQFVHIDDPNRALADVEQTIAQTAHHLTEARARIATVCAEPTLLVQPRSRVSVERAAWAIDRNTQADRIAAHSWTPRDGEPAVHRSWPKPELAQTTPDTARGIGR